MSSVLCHLFEEWRSRTSTGIGTVKRIFEPGVLLLALPDLQRRHGQPASRSETNLPQWRASFEGKRRNAASQAISPWWSTVSGQNSHEAFKFQLLCA